VTGRLEAHRVIENAVRALRSLSRWHRDGAALGDRTMIDLESAVAAIRQVARRERIRKARKR
jgi:hypothetical protein